MPAWLWLIFGILLAILELFVPSGFFLLILGASGVVVGVLGVGELALTWFAQVSVFCVLAIFLWVSVGKRLGRTLFKGAPQQGQIVGSVVVIAKQLAPGEHGSGELWGTNWTVENVDSESLPEGSEAVVVASQGIRLQVKKK